MMAKDGNSGQAAEGKPQAQTGTRRAIWNVLIACGLLATVATPAILAYTCEGSKDPSAEEQSQLVATNPFDLEQGLAIVRMTHQGQGSFIVNLLSAEQRETTGTSDRIAFSGSGDDGRYSGTSLSVADKSGSVDISRAVSVPISGKHLFDVKADGPWTIQVEQPHPSGAPNPTRFSGNSDSATPFFHLSSGPKTVNVATPAGGKFKVFLRDANGNEVLRIPEDGADQPEQTDKSSTLSSSVDIQEDGIYIFDVRADSLWKIEISEDE
ncbi:MAG: hypothetical protein LC740_17250 [Actinobacteria bacterium]|nr:hypothetical protein [Actinomycetota bacterium]